LALAVRLALLALELAVKEAQLFLDTFMQQVAVVAVVTDSHIQRLLAALAVAVEHKA